MRLAQLLLGVPKFRTPKPKKHIRKFSFTSLYKVNPYIVRCPVCQSPHELQTVCGECYLKIKVDTNIIKEEKMGLRPVP